MKRLIYFLSLAIFFMSCEKNDDTPQQVKTFIWGPNISVGLNDKSATLYLSDPRPYSLYAAPGPANPDYFNVFISEDAENYKLYKRLDNFVDSLKIENLTNGKTYYFAASAYGKEFDSVPSNIVTTIPSEKIKIQKYPLDLEISVENLKLSNSLGYMTFYSQDYLGGQMPQSLLMRNNATKEITSLGAFSYYADWNTMGNKLIYMSNTSFENTFYLDRINLLDTDTGNLSEILEVDFKNYLVGAPVFMPGDKSISYLSNKGNAEDYNYDLWTIDIETKEETKISDFENEGFYAYGGWYDWMQSGKEVLIQGRYDFDNSNDNIFRFDIEAKTLTPIIKSRWNDSRPVLSPNNNRVVFISRRSGYFSEDIWLFDLSTSVYRRLTGSPGQHFDSRTSNLFWLDDSKLLITLYNPINQKNEVQIIDLD